jgi:hypothetical protein
MANNWEAEEVYKIILPLEPRDKGVQCGACGMKFDHGKAYGYSCNRTDCPIMCNSTCGVI